MQDPFDDDQPRPKPVSTTSILMRSRMVASFLILGAIPVSVFLLVCIQFSFRESFKDHKYYLEFSALLEGLTWGSVTALAPILWLWLRRSVESLPTRVFLGWAICHLACVVMMSSGPTGASAKQYVRTIVYVAIFVYMFYLLHGFWLNTFIRVTRLNLSWSGRQTPSQFVIVDWLSLAFVVAAIVGGIHFAIPGIWGGLTPLFAYAFVSCLGSALLTLALGCFFSPSKSTYWLLFISVMLTFPFCYMLLLNLTWRGGLTFDVWLNWTAATYAYTLTAMLSFPTLRPR